MCLWALTKIPLRNSSHFLLKVTAFRPNYFTFWSFHGHFKAIEQNENSRYCIPKISSNEHIFNCLCFTMDFFLRSVYIVIESKNHQS